MAESVAQLFLDRSADATSGLWFEGAFEPWSSVFEQATSRAATLERGQHFGVLLENVPEFVYWLGAAALSGAVLVGINPTRRGEELARDIRHTDCTFVVTDEAGASLLAGLKLDCDVRIGGEFSSADIPALPGPDALFMLIFTSGSTGAPKAVQMSQGRAARTAERGGVGFGPDDVLYCSMPLFHGNALLANLFPAMTAGASVALKRKFSASEFLSDVRAVGATYFNYVGRALSYILATPELPDDADNTLKFCVGSEASPTDRRAFRQRFGCFVVEGYSSSEGGVIIQPVSGMPKGALGKPPEGADVVVLDPDTGEECPPHVVGEIVGRDGLKSFEGYYKNDEATQARSRDGWYWTGDLGYRDEDGVFFFAGRTSDWLRVDGENFAAGPVENVISRYPGVRGVVVYPVPDARTGDMVMASIEYDGDFDADGFAAFLAAQPDMGTKWTPRLVRIVDAIPLTATGKVNRNPLRDERWNTEDELWWKPTPKEPFRQMTQRDVAALHDEFAAAGRAEVIA